MVDSLNIMEQTEKQGLGSSLPVLQRLDRIERLLQLLEEKKSLSGTGSHSPSSTFVIRNMADEEDQWKTLSSALEEVHYKGNLLERLEMLEKRVLQLSMDMDIVNKLRSSFSSFEASQKLEKVMDSTTISKSDDEPITISHQEKMDSFKIQENATEVGCERNSQVSQKSKTHRRGFTVKKRKKWLGWLSLTTCGN